MLPNWTSSLLKRCPHMTKRIVLIPIATLGILGFLINTQIQLIPSSSAVCHPKTHIVFLKTHKCAGSSIQNILMRYGDTHKLNFVLPRTGNYLGHPRAFHRTMVGRPRLHLFSFHILAHHTRLDYAEIRAVMPHDSVYITIVRDPIQVFESSFSYYRFDKLFHCDIHKFIESLDSFSQAFLSKRFRGKFGANQMFFDLGGETVMFTNETLVTKYIDQLESWFDLVMIAERMDESLILLRHLLCWDMDDVVTFKLNARHPKFKSNLTDVESSKLLQLNRADQLLYDLFLKKHEEQIIEFGVERMADEVAELQRITNNWYQLCVLGESPFKTRSPREEHYINPRVLRLETKKDVTNNTCSAMTMEELIFTEHLRQRQMLWYPSSFNPLKNVSRKFQIYSKKRTSKPL